MSTYARTRIADRFTLLSHIGAGTFAEIYRATDSETGTLVAVKTLRPEHATNQQMITLFHQEGEIGSALVHPNVVRVLSFGEHAGTHFIVMELVNGISLRRRMRRATPLSISESVRLIRSVLCGLDAIHSAGFVHRDIKPQNILLTPDGTPKITDFGITLRTGGVRAPDDGTTLGTAAYIAPEQAAGWEIGPQADLYAVGVVLYEMLTGQVPFPGDDPVEVMHRHMYETPRDPRTLNADISPALAAVVLRALAKEPEDRFASAREMHDALALLHFDDSSDHAPVRAAAISMRPAGRERAARTARIPFRTSFVGALMLAVLVLILVLALVSSTVDADESLHNAVETINPVGIVVDQPGAATPTPPQPTPASQAWVVTPTPNATAQPPVNNTASTPVESVATPPPATVTPMPSPTPSPTPTPAPSPSPTPSPAPSPTPMPSPTPSPSPSPSPTATPSETPSPSPAPSATSTPEPTATPEPTETPTLQIAQVPVQIVSDAPAQTPAATEQPGHQPQKKHKKKQKQQEASDQKNSDNNAEQQGTTSGEAQQPAAGAENGANANQRKKRQSGKKQDVPAVLDSSQQPTAEGASNGTGWGWNGPGDHRKKRGRP